MTEIKRYDCDVYYDRGMYENSNGGFASYDDHAAIVAERDESIAALQEQVRALRADRDEWERKAISNFENCSKMEEQVRALSVAYERMTYVLINEGIQVPDPKPAEVDTFLNEVRAQAVEGFVEYCGTENSVFVETKAYYRSLEDAVGEYATRIRAGEVQP